jgi:parallel beta-helix repeat protein
VIIGNNIENNRDGIYLDYSSNNTITSNNIENNGYGIVLYSSSENMITSNNITGNNWHGIYLLSSSNNTITSNNIENNGYGIFLWYSSNNTITNNNITGNYWEGTWLYLSPSNTITNNTITGNNGIGILLYSSSSNIVSGNVFVNDGFYVMYSYGNVVEDNTVNGKPLVYLEGVSGYTVTGEVGQVILVNCMDIMVEGLNISNTDVAIELWMTNNTIIANNTITENSWAGIILDYSSNNMITNNTITNNGNGVLLRSSSSNMITSNNIENNMDGIYLLFSTGNTITSNNITGNNWHGIYLYQSSSNVIIGNNIENNRDGIYLLSSSNNTITSNNIENNNWGTYLWYSSYNLVYNNVFVNDVNVVVEGDSFNYWNIEKTPGTNIVGGPYLGGNYWSGFSEICPDTDGDLICDQPYVINENNIDYYPLTLPRVLYLFVVDISGGVWYRVFDGEYWGDWVPLGGIVLDAPSVAYYNGKIYIAVRGEGDSIWYGYINTTTGEFSGWIPIPGLTSSKPTLVSTSSGVLLIARGLGNDIWIYPLTWPNASWINIPGLTVDAPAATAVGDEVHIVVRGLDGYSLWHGVLNVSTWSFTGWNSIHGATDSTPELLADKSTGTIYLVVKDLGNGVSINIYTKTLGWHGWITIPGGLTDRGPALEIMYNKLIVVIKDMGEGIWYNIKQPDGSWTGWTPIDGLTQHQPEILTIAIPLGYVIK